MYLGYGRCTHVYVICTVLRGMLGVLTQGYVRCTQGLGYVMCTQEYGRYIKGYVKCTQGYVMCTQGYVMCTHAMLCNVRCTYGYVVGDILRVIC